MAEMAAVAGILGLSDRITQELVSLQPRRALARSARVMALLASHAAVPAAVVACCACICTSRGT